MYAVRLRIIAASWTLLSLSVDSSPSDCLFVLETSLERYRGLHLSRLSVKDLRIVDSCKIRCRMRIDERRRQKTSIRQVQLLSQNLFFFLGHFQEGPLLVSLFLSIRPSISARSCSSDAFRLPRLSNRSWSIWIRASGPASTTAFLACMSRLISFELSI
jgi:hypothetical protein